MIDVITQLILTRKRNNRNDEEQLCVNSWKALVVLAER